MKRKLLGVCLTIALVTTLGLVTAVPVGAVDAEVVFETWDEGVSDNWSHTPAGYSGSYCLDLSGPMIVKVAYGETLADLAVEAAAQVDSMDVWDIQWTIYDTASTGDKLHAKLYLDTTGNGAADTVLTGGFGAVEGGGRTNDRWDDAYMRTDAAWGIDTYDGVDYTGGATIATVVYSSYPPGYTLSTLLNDATAGATWSAAIVTHIAYGYGGTDGSGFVDDITVAGDVYEVEPPLPPLDEAYYKVDDVATVTVYDINANTNAAVRETILVTAAGDVPAHSFSLGLMETGVDTGIFTETFTLVDTTPGTGELLVSHGSTIILTYESVAMDDTAEIDTVVPVVAITAPTDADFVSGNTTVTWTITETNPDTFALLIDGEVVASATSPYNWVTTLEDDGSISIQVTATDDAGNIGSDSIDVTVDNTAPLVSDAAASPVTIMPDVAGEVTFTATVTDAGSGIATVKIDLSTAGGGAAVDMLDGGVAPDVTEDDGIYTASANITASEGNYDALTITATDDVDVGDANVNATVDITLGVWSDITDPVIASPAIAYLYGLSSAPPGGVGGTVTVSANVTDAGGMGTVTATCDAFTGSVSLLDDGNTPDATADDDVYTGTATVETGTSGNYTITIAAVDAKSNEATPNTSLTLTVAPDTGWDINLVEGWNLISLPLMPTDGSIDVLLADISDNVTQVRTWVYESGVLTEKVWVNDGPAGFTEMTAGCGYWIQMTQEITLTVTGVVLPPAPQAPPSYSVYEGWNFIGFKALSAYTAEVYLGGAVVLTFERMYGYDAAGDVYTVIQPTTPNLEPGQGYWLAVSADGTIYP